MRKINFKLIAKEVIKDEINDVVQEQVIERFVEPDMSGLVKLLVINTVLIILFAVLCSYLA